MNDPKANMTEPSSGVPNVLLPHVHLVSTYTYPNLSNANIDTIVEYLLSAPKIAREVAAMNWRFLDAPQDGTVMLVWQPLNQLGIRSASDGYVWLDPEQAYNQEHKGYVRNPKDAQYGGTN
ncbi:hypothetical protein MMC25_007643 [Agyrium rufum]|nr:hypothetical protein [Agyrium rufum]